MNGKKIERLLSQLLISILIGGLATSLVYAINQKTGVLIEIGSAISKSISIIGAIVISLLIKRYVDYQDKVKDIELSSKAPSSVVHSFQAQKDDYFSVTYKHPIHLSYLGVCTLMILVCLIVPLGQIKANVSLIYYIVFDAGLTIATISFLLFFSYEIILRTEEARKAKVYFERLKEMESERQTLIETLNKKLREQKDVDRKNTSPLRENKEFDLRGYLEGLEKKEHNE